LRVALSIGVATVADLGPRAGDLAPDDLAEALLERADARMYAAKRAGRDQTVR
jgi:GGDEF domain-containing protein